MSQTSGTRNRLELVHLGHQCPWVCSTESCLREMAHKSDLDFRARDFWADPIGIPFDIFFSFNAVLNGKVITGSPFFDDTIEIETIEPMGDYLAEPSIPESDLSSIVPLSTETINDSISVCCNGDPSLGLKNAWYSKNKENYRGFVGYGNGSPKAILEFVNTEHCPFPAVPPVPNAVVIVCLYSNDQDFRYQSSIIDHFLGVMMNEGKERVFVFAARRSHYPNGTCDFFFGKGFRCILDVGKTYVLDRGTDNVVLLEKKLREV